MTDRVTLLVEEMARSLLAAEFPGFDKYLPWEERPAENTSFGMGRDEALRFARAAIATLSKHIPVREILEGSRIVISATEPLHHTEL